MPIKRCGKHAASFHSFRNIGQALLVKSDFQCITPQLGPPT